MPQAVILVVDGLGAKHLGPYGNTWIETSAFNRLGSQSLLMQNVYAPGRLAAAYHELWSTANGHDHENLLALLNSWGVATSLVTDSAEVTDLTVAGFFQEQTELEPPQGLKLAETWADSHTAEFFAQAVAALEEGPADALLWLHTSGLGNPWDAPFAFRSRFADEDDPDPSTSAQVPSLELDEGYDPDALHEIRCALAGQVTLVDRCLDGLLAVIEEVAEKHNTLFLVTSPRGFPLGEHGVVGWRGAKLYPELLRVPVFLRFPQQHRAMERSMGLGELGDLATMLVQWFAGEPVEAMQRDFSVCRHEQELLLRTPVWHHRLPAISAMEAAQCELYFKPDDQHEVNDVSDRCEHIVAAGCDFIRDWLKDPGTSQVPPLLLQAPD